MRLFKLKTSESKEDIIRKFNSLRAVEPHKIFTFSDDDYYENRIGLHTYINGDIIKGYYESGRINRLDSLESEKAWFYGKLVEKNGVCQFRGIIFFSTILIDIIGLPLGIIQYIYYPTPLCIILYILYNILIYKEEYKTFECLKKIML